MDRNSDSSITGESQTPSSFPSGDGGNAGRTGRGMGSGWGNPGGMGGMPGMGGMGMGMGGYPRYYGMGGMPGMPGMDDGMPGMDRMPKGIGGMARMAGMMGGMPGVAGGSRPGIAQSPFEDNVYWPSLDHLTQYTGINSFSLEELGLSSMREQTPQPIGRESAVGRRGMRSSIGGRGSSSVGRSKRKGKGKGVAGESSQEGEEGEDVEGRRSVWTPEECTALAKAWISVVDDPIRSNNQNTDEMWARILASYEVFKPAGAKYHKSEELWKQWERIRVAVSRFAGIYENNSRTMTSGMTMDDVKELSYRQFPEARRFGQFKYWDAYVELINSPKFLVGVEAGWPKRTRLNVSDDYSSSAGSYDLANPPPVPRRRRPVGQKMAMRMSRGASSGSEVQSAAPSAALTDVVRIQATKHLFDVIEKWNAAKEPKYKKYLESLIDEMRRALGMSVDDDDEPAAVDGQEDSDE